VVTWAPLWPDSPELPGEKQKSPLSALLQTQHRGGLVNLLHYGDAMSMAASVEARNPFMDHHLVEMAWTLPAEFKVRGAQGKFIHRNAMKNHLPNYIFQQPKLGYATPVTRIFDGHYTCSSGETPLDVLTSKTCMERGLFDRNGLNQVIASHSVGARDHGYFLFRLLSAELWYRQFIDKAVA
jgi:asparagine synthase (glutamine-hydrolysing)